MNTTQADINVRIANDGAASDGAKLVAHEITEGVVYERGGVKITAFEVDHAPIKPAFGFRIDYGGRSVVLSGDTRLSENLIRHAQAVDLLVHESWSSTYGRSSPSGDRHTLRRRTCIDQGVEYSRLPAVYTTHTSLRASVRDLTGIVQLDQS